MGGARSSLSEEQEKKVLSLFGHAKLDLLYKASTHDYTSKAFHEKCDLQGPTVVVAYNAAGFIFGAYTNRDYTQKGGKITDGGAFLFSIHGETGMLHRFPVNTAGECAFTDGTTGPDYGALVFLHNDKAEVTSNPGKGYSFAAADMHGNDLKLTECEVYKVEDLGFLPTPWRKTLWTTDNKNKLMDTIMNYKPAIQSVEKARILLIGPTGAGKSSFFNSVNSTFWGNMTCQAISGCGEKSVTTQFRTYNLKSGKNGKPMPLVLCDTMSLQNCAGAGLEMDDLVTILKGHLEDGYQFKNNGPLQSDETGFRKSVTLKDKVHCVVYVVDSNMVQCLPEKTVKKMAAIRVTINRMGLPQLVLMTKVDKACPFVATNLQDVYRSPNIQRKTQQLSDHLGIPVSCILPVKNYSHELELDDTTDILLLTAVVHMLNFADSFFENTPGGGGEVTRMNPVI